MTVTLYGLSIGGTNSAFAKWYYDRYNGAYLDKYAKDDILRVIPRTGVFLNAQTEFQALSVGYGPFAFTTRLVGGVNGRIAREVFEILFEQANEIGRRYSFQPAWSEGSAYGIFSFSYGQKIKFTLPWLNHFGVGVNLKYYRGIYYSRISQSHFQAITRLTSTEANGIFAFKQAQGGRGFGLDAGVVGTFARHYRLSLFIENLFSRVTWNNKTELFRVSFATTSSNIEQMLTNNANADSLFTSGDTTYAIDPFSIGLPVIFRLGILRSFGQLVVTGQWEQSFRDSAFSTKSPLFATGCEYRPLRFLRLRAGLSYGGSVGYAISYGFGLLFGPVRWDFAGRSYGGLLPRYHKGFLLGTSLVLRY